MPDARIQYRKMSCLKEFVSDQMTSVGFSNGDLENSLTFAPYDKKILPTHVRRALSFMGCHDAFAKRGGAVLITLEEGELLRKRSTYVCLLG